MAEKMEIKVPNLGDIADVEILEIFVSPGDIVAQEDPLLSLETDKAVMEVPAPADGTINSFTVKVGDKISEGDLIGYLLSEGESGSEKSDSNPPPEKETEKPESPKQEKVIKEEASPKKEAAPKSSGSTNFTPSVNSGKYHGSPSIRKFARELGADLNQVSGSGPKGRILKEDVQQWIKGQLQGGSVSGTMGIGSLPAVKPGDFEKFGDVETLELGRIKKISGKRLQASWQNLPHVTHFEEADITDLESFRKDLNKQLEKQGQKVTPLAFIILAVVKALKEFPSFNSSLSDDGGSLYLKKYYNIGFAADTPDGLLVPVIHEAGNMGIKEIASALNDLSGKARDKKLESKFLSGGTFTISSLGGIGGTGFTPIINPPEAAILGVSRSKWQPVWSGTEFQPRLILPFSLSYDHRIIDGAEAARFCRYIAQILTDFRLSAL